jgi:hypothetical protein
VDFPSLVAVIVTDPGLTAASVPSCAIVAMLTLLELQAIAFPDRTLPLASLACALN